MYSSCCSKQVGGFFHSYSTLIETAIWLTYVCIANNLFDEFVCMQYTNKSEKLISDQDADLKVMRKTIAFSLVTGCFLQFLCLVFECPVILMMLTAIQIIFFSLRLLPMPSLYAPAIPSSFILVQPPFLFPVEPDVPVSQPEPIFLVVLVVLVDICAFS